MVEANGEPDPEKAKGLGTAVVDALRAQPAVLALVVLNIIIAISILNGIKEVRKREHDFLVLVAGRCLPLPAGPAAPP